jgi:hypothetical protein
LADQKIELEIVFDDGSVKKAFASIKEEARKTGEEVGGFLGQLGGFGASVVVLNQGIELFNKMAGSVKAVANEMINLSLEAEKIRVTQTQFTALTQQAGIATEAFNNSLQRSIDGLIDDDEALQIANEAMIRLGENASRLPQIFELSRKAAAAGFGDMTRNAEAFSMAIQTGQTRQLRSIGILVDVTKEQEKFAKSIGLTAAQLSESQKQYVNSNVILAEAEKKFKNVNSNVAELSISIQKFKVQSAEAFERFAIAFDKAFGPAIKKTIDDLTRALELNGNRSKEIVATAEKSAESHRILTERIKLLNQEIRAARSPTRIDQLNEEIMMATESMKKLEAQFARTVFVNKGDDKLAQNAIRWKQDADMRQKNEEQKQQAIHNTIEAERKALQMSEQFRQQKVQAMQSNLEFETNSDLAEQQRLAIHEEQLRLITEKGIADRKAIQELDKQQNGISTEEARALELQQIQAQNEQIIALQNKFQNDSLDSFDQQAKRRQQQFKNFSVVAKTFFFDVISQGFQQVGAALVNGENAFQAFGKVFLGILGDIVIALGNSFIAAGIANTFIPLFGFGGIGAIGAGAALVVLGGALKALSGGAGSSSFSQSPGAGNQGGGNFSDTNNFNPANPVDVQRVQPNTVVNFTINGDVFDSDATQDRIVKLINDGVDTKGLVVRGNA